MSYQIHHRELGVYQGSYLGLSFWHPISEKPEQGFCAFPTREEAQAHVDFLCSPACDCPLQPPDLTIEPFDPPVSAGLIEPGAGFTQAQEAIRAFAATLRATVRPQH